MPLRYHRFNLNSIHFVIDVAHNRNGIEALLNLINRDYNDKQIIYVCGFSQKPTLYQCFEAI